MAACGSFNVSELSRNSLVHDKGNFHLCSGISENYLLSKSYSSRCSNFKRSCLWSRNLSSNVGERSGEKDNDSEDGFPDIDEAAEGTVEPDEEVKNEEFYTEGGILDGETDSVGNRSVGNRVESPLSEAIIRAPRYSVNDILIKWVEEGNPLGRGEISLVMLNLNKRRLYKKALQVLHLFSK